MQPSPKLSNVLGVSIKKSFIIVCFAFQNTAPPSIVEDASTPSVICEKQTVCFLSCLATSDYPVSYSWTKSGEIPDNDGVKIMSNTLAVKPREAKDFGVYVCRATNRFGSTAFKITLSECPKCSTVADTAKGDDSEYYQHLIDLYRGIC